MSTGPSDFQGPSQYPGLGSQPGGSNLGSLSQSAGSGLGSLAQSARSTHLKQAKRILITIGILGLLVNLPVAFFARNIIHQQIMEEVAALNRQGKIANPWKVQELEDAQVRAATIVSGLFSFAGLLYIIFGILIYTYPVPMTVTSLILYLGVTALMLYYNPDAFKSGIWVLVVRGAIMISLIKAIQAAVASEKDRRLAAGAS